MSLIVIGGIDPTGRAGIARDLAVCAAMQVDAHPVVTCLTVQGDDGVRVIHPTPHDVLNGMLDAAATQRPTHVKIGAITGPDQAATVAAFAAQHSLPVILDPVLEPTRGAPFCKPADLAPLLQLATLVTPNQQEAEALGLEEDERVHITRGGTIPGVHRGTGCRFATRVAALMVRGIPKQTAIAWAHADLEREIAFDAQDQALAGERHAHWLETRDALWKILAELDFQSLPEVGINFAYALPGAKEPADMCGLAGRITIAGMHRDWTGRIAYGGPHHTGRIILVVQEYDAEIRIVMNHRYDPQFLANARKAGLLDASFRRADEPPEVPSTMEWGVRQCIEANNRVPDLIWDAGGDGKEPMIRVFAKNPEELVVKLRAMRGLTSESNQAIPA